MKTPLIFSASLVLAATLQAMPAYRLETTPTSSGFINTQIGFNDLSNKSGQASIGAPIVQTNGSGSTSAAGGFGGSASPFNRPEFGPVIPGANALNGGTGGSLAQPNGPALPVPEPSSSWLLLALALIPILKVRSNRKSRAA